MEILVGYSIRPRIERVLRIYWDHLLMVDRSGRYYGDPFLRLCGVALGEPLSTTILNMVVDSVMCHWVTIATGEEAGPDGFGLASQWLAAF